jgi:hypothetical protein
MTVFPLFYDFEAIEISSFYQTPKERSNNAKQKSRKKKIKSLLKRVLKGSKKMGNP